MVRQHTTLTRCWLILVLASIQRINGFSTTADCAITSRSIKFSCTPKNHPSCSTSSSSTMYSSLASDDQQTQQEEDFDSDMNQYYERFRKFRRGGLIVITFSGSPLPETLPMPLVARQPLHQHYYSLLPLRLDQLAPWLAFCSFSLSHKSPCRPF